MLKDGILCFVAFLDVFSTEKWLPKPPQKIRTPGPPPYLGLSHKKYHFFDAFPMPICRRIMEQLDIGLTVRSQTEG